MARHYWVMYYYEPLVVKGFVSSTRVWVYFHCQHLAGTFWDYQVVAS